MSFQCKCQIQNPSPRPTAASALTRALLWKGQGGSVALAPTDGGWRGGSVWFRRFQVPSLLAAPSLRVLSGWAWPPVPAPLLCLILRGPSPKFTEYSAPSRLVPFKWHRQGNPSRGYVGNKSQMRRRNVRRFHGKEGLVPALPTRRLVSLSVWRTSSHHHRRRQM